jgi:hypothetical protein
MGHRFPQHQHALTASGMVLCEDVGPFQSSKTKAAKRPFLLARTEARRHALRKFCEQFLNLHFTSRDTAEHSKADWGSCRGCPILQI